MNLIAQFAAENWPTLLFAYGPLGGISWWLSRQVEKLLGELRERDKLVREISDQHVKAMEIVSHKLSGISRALVYNAATHGPESIRRLAEDEIKKWDGQAK